MTDAKQDVIEMLHELAELTMLDEGDPQSFRVRAYESAAHGLEAYAGEIAAMTPAQLQKIGGVGKSTAQKIRELIDAGRVQKLDELRSKYPASLMALLKLQGLGPKGVIRLRAELGIESVDDLRGGVKREHKIRALKGFGEKSGTKLAETLERLDSEGSTGRTPISVALPLAERVVERLAAVEGATYAAYCGSLRRFSETIGDVDVVVVSPEPSKVMEALVTMPVVDRVLVRGDLKTSVVTRRGIQIDVRVVEASQIGAALLYFTGSKGHNIKLRQRAIARGMSLNEYALTETATGRVVASETEESIYAALGLPWIPPVLREDGGEIELAEQKALPRAIEPKDVLGDFHVHTAVSGDGRSDLEDVVNAARERGYRLLAITEHAEGTVAGVNRDAMLAQRARIEALQTKVGSAIRIFHGIELNIGPEGELDYDAEFRAKFDFCLASVHDFFSLDRAAQTKRVTTAMRDPHVKMIGHLTARMIGGRPPIDLDIDEVLRVAEETKTALEINGSLPRLDASVDVVRRARGREVNFVLTSDAHHTSELGRMRYACLNAQRAGIDPARVVNTWEYDKLVAWASA